MLIIVFVFLSCSEAPTAVLRERPHPTGLDVTDAALISSIDLSTEEPTKGGSHYYRPTSPAFFYAARTLKYKTFTMSTHGYFRDAEASLPNMVRVI